MKKLFVLLSMFALTGSVYAATATPATTTAPNATPDAQQKLDTLKDRLASAATQLRQSQKRALAGTVKATSVSTITVSTKTNDVKIELADDVKVFQIIDNKRTSIDTDKLTKGDAVVVFGDYDANLDLLKAKVIFIQDDQPIRIAGTIFGTSKKDYTITVTTPEGKSYIVDYETTTKSFTWDAAGGTAKGVFAKLLVGDTVHVLAWPEKKENRISAIRIMDIGNLSGAAPTPTPAPEASPSATPKPTAKPSTTPNP